MAGDIAIFRAKLKGAINDTMTSNVLDGAQKAIAEAVLTEVYARYSPVFLSRRGAAGGLADKGNMEKEYGDYTLWVWSNAPWQHLWGGAMPSERLADAVAEGSVGPLKHAGARPFHEHAESKYAGSGQFDKDLAAGLRAAGFLVIGA